MNSFKINKMPMLFNKSNHTHDNISVPRILHLRPGNVSLPEVIQVTQVTQQPVVTSNLRLSPKERPCQTSNYLRLFENFLVVTGDLSQPPLETTLDQKISYAYPSALSPDKEKIVPLFCYPNGITMKEVDKEEVCREEVSIFVLNS